MHQIEITRIKIPFQITQNSSYLNEAILIGQNGITYRDLRWYYYYNYLMSLNNFLDNREILIFTDKKKDLAQFLDEEGIEVENNLVRVLLKQVIPNRFNFQIEKYCIIFHDENKLKENMKAFLLINVSNVSEGKIRKSKINLTEKQLKEKAKRMRNPKTNCSLNHSLLKWHTLTAFQFGNDTIKSIFEKDMYEII